MHGLVLAGGRGSRLAADGIETPKALIEVAGRPQLLRLIDTFLELGCESVTCMVRNGIRVDFALPARAQVRNCRTPSSLHTLAEGLAAVPQGPVFCAMVDTVMPVADWRRVYQAVAERLAAGSVAVLAVTPFIDDEVPLYVSCDEGGRVSAISDAPIGQRRVLVTGGVYGFGPAARPLASAAVSGGEGGSSLHRMRAFLKLLVDLRLPLATVEVPRIIDLDHKRDLEAAQTWLTA